MSITLGNEKDICDDYAFHSKRRRIMCSEEQENSSALNNSYVGYRVSMPKWPDDYCEKESHPLMFRGSHLVMNHPVMSSILDECLNQYLLKSCHITQSWNGGPLLPSTANENVLEPSADAFELLSKKDVISMLKSAAVKDIFNWISLVQLFLKKNDLNLEPFQKLIFMHSVFFIATTRANEHNHLLDRILSSYFDLDSVDWKTEIEDFKKQICAFVVTRRQGKTFATVIFLAAAMLTVKNIKLAYVAHIRFQSNTVMKDIRKRMDEMRELIQAQSSEFGGKFSAVQSINEQQALGTISVKFEDGSESIGKIASCNNKDVSILKYLFFY